MCKAISSCLVFFNRYSPESIRYITDGCLVLWKICFYVSYCALHPFSLLSLACLQHCPDGWFNYKYRCFMFINTPMTWYSVEVTGNCNNSIVLLEQSALLSCQHASTTQTLKDSACRCYLLVDQSVCQEFYVLIEAKEKTVIFGGTQSRDEMTKQLFRCLAKKNPLYFLFSTEALQNPGCSPGLGHQPQRVRIPSGTHVDSQSEPCMAGRLQPAGLNLRGNTTSVSPPGPGLKRSRFTQDI